jgi:hypothetical protein
MPQYPQIVLFSRGLPSKLTNQQFRFEVNPEPVKGHLIIHKKYHINRALEMEKLVVPTFG